MMGQFPVPLMVLLVGAINNILDTTDVTPTAEELEVFVMMYGEHTSCYQ